MYAYIALEYKTSVYFRIFKSFKTLYHKFKLNQLRETRDIKSNLDKVNLNMK